jgi:DnaJ family protein C protein 13
MRASELDGSLDARDAIKWQDENVHVKIQLGIALDFLEALLRISGNNSNNGENFPPSAACCHFSREEIFCHLVQALLRAKTPIFTRCSTIICTICCCSDSSVFSGGLSVCLSTSIAEHS